ncbi:MAG: hypothetical protein JWM85_1890, partial [Acidimicrobiaceae bacterium]|nr:hypothetical protein [Acidimicrobiaceae bacterium]
MAEAEQAGPRPVEIHFDGGTIVSPALPDGDVFLSTSFVFD